MPILFFRFALLTLLALSSVACATKRDIPSIHPSRPSVLQEGKKLFDAGYYKSAMKELLPLACDGVAEAQYAVGYMYYYGYGVSQDTDVGYFWIRRSANRNFEPAIKALTIISRNNQVPERKKG